ncbi:hypothetical protein OROHE_005392 [Orobanche hederae]
MASKLNLDIRSDGYVKVQDLLKLDKTTSAKIPLRSHTIEDIIEAVRHDDKQRFSLVEENGELLLRANKGHTLTVCMRREVDTIIFLDVKKDLEVEEGMKLYVSDNKVILTEGFDGVVPVKYFQKIESWPQRQPIPF